MQRIPCTEETCEACTAVWNRRKAARPGLTYQEVAESRSRIGACSPAQQCGGVHELIEWRRGSGSCRCGKKKAPGINTLSVDKIINTVCDVHGVTRSALVSKSREVRLCEARHDVCYFLRNHSMMTLKTIATLVGRTDHATVINSVAASKSLASMFTVCADRIEEISRRLTL